MSLQPMLRAHYGVGVNSSVNLCWGARFDPSYRSFFVHYLRFLGLKKKTFLAKLLFGIRTGYLSVAYGVAWHLHFAVALRLTPCIFNDLYSFALFKNPLCARSHMIFLQVPSIEQPPIRIQRGIMLSSGCRSYQDWCTTLGSYLFHFL
jgi:hypothetical protein